MKRKTGIFLFINTVFFVKERKRKQKWEIFAFFIAFFVKSDKINYKSRRMGAHRRGENFPLRIKLYAG